MRQTLYDYCTQYGKTHLLDEWAAEKNTDFTPKTITYGSSRKVWWRCRHGHEWQSAVYTRTTQGSGCPFCTHVRLQESNTLAAVHPELVAQWHPSKNGALRADQIASGSHTAVWWICEKGHEWKAQVKSRVANAGCPVCTNRVAVSGVNDLATTQPTLSKQWHPEKNAPLTAQCVVAGSSRKVWWICEKGHEWQAKINSRVAGVGCPVCASKVIIAGENDLATCNPLLAAQWLQEKNAPLRPDQVSPSSNRRVWWQCAQGHQWQAKISCRNHSNEDCPYCMNRKVLAGFNDLQTREPEVAKEWHPVLNGELTPAQVVYGSHRRVWWLCTYGHVWKAAIYSRTGAAKSGCPACAGKVKYAKQRYYEAVESDAALAKLTAESVPDDIWTNLDPK